MAVRSESATARSISSWGTRRYLAYSATGSEQVMPWLPLPQLMTTGMAQPLMRASEPAAAAARARHEMSSGLVSRSVLPMRAPQSPDSPSSEIAALSSTWRSTISRMSST